MPIKTPLRFPKLAISIIFSMLVLGVVAWPSLGYANETPVAEDSGGEAAGEHSGEGADKLPDSKKDLLETDPGSPSLKGPFIELKQMNVVAIYRNRPVRHMNYIFVLEMPSMEKWRFVMDRLEPVRSAMVLELHKIGSAQKGALLKDFDFLKARLLKTVERVIGPGHVSNVLVKSSAGQLLPGYYAK